MPLELGAKLLEPLCTLCFVFLTVAGLINGNGDYQQLRSRPKRPLRFYKAHFGKLPYLWKQKNATLTPGALHCSEPTHNITNAHLAYKNDKLHPQGPWDPRSEKSSEHQKEKAQCRNALRIQLIFHCLFHLVLHYCTV